MDVSKFVDIKLEGKSNWIDWKADILTLLRHKEVIGVIDGTIKMPDPISLSATVADREKFNEEMKSYIRADTCAVLIIRSTLSQEVRGLIRMCPDNAKTIWKELCNNFERRSDLRLCKLNQDFYKARQGTSESLLTFVARIRTLWAELQKEFQTEQNMKLPEILLVNKILSELPEEFSEFQTTWDGTPKTDQTIEELINRLKLRESRQELCENEKSVLINKLSNHQEYKYYNKFKKNSSRNSKRDKSCDDNSYKFRGKCNKCNKFAGHMARDCQEQYDDEGCEGDMKMLLSFNASTSHATKENIWIKDDGATDHMTNSKKYFKNYRDFKKPIAIIVGDGSCKLQAFGRGDIDMRSKVNGRVLAVTFAQVLYVPGLIRNCFSSVKAMTRGISHKGDAKTMTTTFYSADDGEVLLEGTVKDGQFELQVRPIVPKNSATACVIQRKECGVRNGERTLREWHEILCHQGKKYVQQFLKQKDIKYINEDFFCEPCAYGKLSRRPFKTRLVRAQSVGEIIHADLCEAEQVSMGGNKYFLVLKDDYSKFRQVFTLKNKSETGVKISSYILKAERNGINIREIITDGGREFNNQVVKQFLDSKGIQLRIVMPYTHEQNGGAERENRILVEMSRTMLKAAELPKELWAEAVSTAAYVLNLTGKSSEEGVSPYELWYGKVPSIKHLRRFGSTSYVHLPRNRRKKFDSKSIKGILVGYVNYDGYRVFIPSKMEVVLSTNVLFNENEVVCFRKRIPGNEKLSSRRLEPESLKKLTQPNFRWADEVEDVYNYEVKEAGVSTTSPHETEKLIVNEDEENESNSNKSQNVSVSKSVESQNTSSSLREGRVLRPRENLKPPDRFQASMVVTPSIDEPLSYSQAIQSPNNADWVKAMKSEIASLEMNKTWVLVELPVGKKAISSRWLYKIKRHADGTIERYKARLVAKGYTQVAGIDYKETFSPVVRYDTIRAVLALSVEENLHLSQLDVETAFLHGDLEEDIYMHQPEGYNDGSSRVCKLVKSLYGLKQSPRCWNKKFTDFVRSYGLKESDADPCLFVSSKPGHKLVLGIFVDDGLLAAEKEEDIEVFLKGMSDTFKIRSGPLKHYLGMEIEKKIGSIFIHQMNHAERLVAKFHQESCNPVTVPITKGQLGVDRDNAEELSPDLRVQYRATVGGLLYMAICTRPDISYAVSIVSQNLENPKQSDWVNVKRILRYLKGTSSLGIEYSKGRATGLEVYSDADYAGCTDTRKSRTGIVSFYNNKPISWFSKKQTSVALSTTEAEFMAASEAAKEAIWLKRLYEDMCGHEKSPQILTDNQSCVQYVKNQNFHMRTKHIDVRYKFIKEKYSEGQIKLKYVPAEEQRADILTKPLELMLFKKLRKMLSLSQLEDFKGGC